MRHDKAYTELRDWFKQDDWQGDQWGTCMGYWFDVAAELWWRGEVPASWQYRPPVGLDDPRESDSLSADFIRDSSTDALVAFGNTLERYSRALRHAGLDY